MKHTQEEILDALQVIKDTCVEVGEQNKGCYKCPFAEKGLCKLIAQEPYAWEINCGEMVWRAFK